MFNNNYLKPTPVVMRQQRISHDAVHRYMSDITSRIVAESGNPDDRFHLGKLVLHGLKNNPDLVLQIDGATGQSETSGSVLERSVKCANCFRNFGLEINDIVIIMAPSHLDLAIPFYAALYLGIGIGAVDRTLTVNELKGTFKVQKPKIIFCQSEKAPDAQIALNELDMDTKIVTFDKGDYLCSFGEFMDASDGPSAYEFKPNDFDPEETISFLISTSGTTGLPKAAATTHKNFAIAVPYWWSKFTKFPTPTQMALVVAPLQWLTSMSHFLLAPILQYTKLQSSLPVTKQMVCYLINHYKPTYTVLSPTMMMSLLKPDDEEKCDLTCFELLILGGSAVPPSLLHDIKQANPVSEVRDGYGMSELSGIGFQIDDPPPGSCGRPLGCLQYRLIDITTKEDICVANKQGELWLKGPTLFKEYYTNPVATNEAFAEGGWFKTGDIFYRDENWNYFFVERYKLLLKYMSYHISPVEVENVIRQCPGVLDAAVSGIPDPECGDLVVALVIRKPDSEITAQDVKDFVKESLSDAKQLRGGVIFVDSLPLTASTKIHRRKLRDMVLELERE